MTTCSTEARVGLPTSRAQGLGPGEWLPYGRASVGLVRPPPPEMALPAQHTAVKAEVEVVPIPGVRVRANGENNSPCLPRVCVNFFGRVIRGACMRLCLPLESRTISVESAW